MRIHCLQHVAFETPGTILEWAESKGHTISYSYFFEKEFSLPALDAFDSLLIMGGYMNVDEEAVYPWLKTEKQLIKLAIDAGKKIIGICLGAQLIASVLGAAVYKSKEKEIGFFPVQFSLAGQQHPFFNHFTETYTFFHWHGDTFYLPEDAVLIASTETCRHQAFTVNDRILALQFHPEMNEYTIEQMLLHDGSELEEKGDYIQSVEDIRKNYSHLAQNRRDFFILLDNFLVVN